MRYKQILLLPDMSLMLLLDALTSEVCGAPIMEHARLSPTLEWRLVMVVLGQWFVAIRAFGKVAAWMGRLSRAQPVIQPRSSMGSSMMITPSPGAAVLSG